MGTATTSTSKFRYQDEQDAKNNFRKLKDGVDYCKCIRAKQGCSGTAKFKNEEFISSNEKHSCVVAPGDVVERKQKNAARTLALTTNMDPFSIRDAVNRDMDTSEIVSKRGRKSGETQMINRLRRNRRGPHIEVRNKVKGIVL
jgi:hypothetical protein